jgi:hypothetical protein
VYSKIVVTSDDHVCTVDFFSIPARLRHWAVAANDNLALMTASEQRLEKVPNFLTEKGFDV